MALHDVQGRRYPKRTEAADWVMLLRETRWMPIEDMIDIHIALHRTFGAEPSDAVLEGERELSVSLRSLGIEHRYDDKLSKDAGTYVEVQADPTLEELAWYLKRMTVHSNVVMLRQGVEDSSQVFVDINTSLLPGNAVKSVLKALNKMMPPGVMLKTPPKSPKEDFAREMGAYDLVLSPTYRPVMVVPWKTLIESAPEAVLKEDRLQINMKGIVKFEEVVLKEGEAPERYVLSPVLIPEREDTQGEIYSKEVVRKACHWWAEHSNQFSHRHVLQGGRALNGELVALENYLMPATCVVGKEELPEGTWMLGAGVRDDDLWAQVVAGKLTTWSIGADVLSWMETVEEPAN
jgi:hypothetical protein